MYNTQAHRSSQTTMGYVFPLINAVHVRTLECDIDYYESCVVEETFIEDTREAA